MNYTHLIDSCQSHLPMQYASNIEHRTHSPEVTRRRATPETHVQNKPLVCSMAVRVHFPFYTKTKPLMQLYFKYKTVLILKFLICSWNHEHFGSLAKLT